MLAQMLQTVLHTTHGPQATAFFGQVAAVLHTPLPVVQIMQPLAVTVLLIALLVLPIQQSPHLGMQEYINVILVHQATLLDLDLAA